MYWSIISLFDNWLKVVKLNIGYVSNYTKLYYNIIDDSMIRIFIAVK